MVVWNRNYQLSNPELLVLPKTLNAHLENFFPSLVIFYGNTAVGKVAQIHVFVPEAENRTRTYILMFGVAKNPIFKAIKPKILNLAKVVVEQDSDILGKIYPNTPQKIKLNNEVGMDWVRRNFASWPEVVAPNFSK